MDKEALLFSSSHPDSNELSPKAPRAAAASVDHPVPIEGFQADEAKAFSKYLPNSRGLLDLEADGDLLSAKESLLNHQDTANGRGLRSAHSHRTFTVRAQVAAAAGVPNEDGCLAGWHERLAGDPEDGGAMAAIWWCSLALLCLAAGGAGFLSAASLTCFVRSWSDKHHWWPNAEATDFLQRRSCPTNYLPPLRAPWRRGWTSHRLVLASLFLASGAVWATLVGAAYRQMRGRLRERRLEDRYPWLSRALDRLNLATTLTESTATASASALAASAETRRRGRLPSVTRRDAAASFAEGFQLRMAAVHDATLSVELRFKGLCVEAGGKKLLHQVCREPCVRVLGLIMSTK
jgi:hypothetical protein